MVTDPQLGHRNLVPFSRGDTSLPQLLHIGGVADSTITGPLLLARSSTSIMDNRFIILKAEFKNIIPLISLNVATIFKNFINFLNVIVFGV